MDKLVFYLLSNLENFCSKNIILDLAMCVCLLLFSLCFNVRAQIEVA